MAENDFKLAKASFMDGSLGLSPSGFYMPNTIDGINRAMGLSPEKLVIPNDYHELIKMCYDFYVRGGLAAMVIDRLAELTITDVQNGQRKTSDEANDYFEAVLHSRPSRMYRFIRNMALEYYITGMVLPRVEWTTLQGQDISPKLRPNKEYLMPTFDLYPPLLTNVVWVGWGKKDFYLKIPQKDINMIKNQGGRVKEQQLRYNMLVTSFPDFITAVTNGTNQVKLDVDAIMRKELSFQPYPTPYLSKVLESLIFKQQLRRMDFAVASRIVNAILLVQEGDKDFPLTEETRGNLDELKAQILARSNNPLLLERLFMLFSNHTTKLTWITPDVEALLNQDKYRQANEEINEGLGFPRILIVGESRNAGAAEVSTWAIQPQMEEFRTMLLEWIQTIYNQASEFNKFRNTPEAGFTPIKLQDFVKTAAVFAQAYREGNVSRKTRDQMIGLNFETEIEQMIDEAELMKELPKDFPQMPYNTQLPPNNAVGIGGNNQVNKTGGKKVGTTNTAVNPKNSGVRIQGTPLARTQPNSRDSAPVTKKTAAENIENVELMSDEEVVNLIDKIARERGILVTIDTLS